MRLNDIFLVGTGALGALSTNHAGFDVGSGRDPAEGIVADSAEFDSASEVGFQITGSGPAAGEDYSQLVSTGPVASSAAKLLVHVSPPSPESTTCPTLRRGQTYTFISTTGALSGSFANAPEGGAEIEARFAKAYNQPPRPLRIAYHRVGATQTVTGTVEAAAQEEQEARERREAQEHRKDRNGKPKPARKPRNANVGKRANARKPKPGNRPRRSARCKAAAQKRYGSHSRRRRGRRR